MPVAVGGAGELGTAVAVADAAGRDIPPAESAEKEVEEVAKATPSIAVGADASFPLKKPATADRGCTAPVRSASEAEAVGDGIEDTSTTTAASPASALPGTVCLSSSTAERILAEVINAPTGEPVPRSCCLVCVVSPSPRS